MPAAKTKKPTKSAPKKAAPKVKKSSKLTRFFSSKKNVAILVIVVVFAGVGSFQLYRTSAAQGDKSLKDCIASRPTLREGSKHNCVRPVQNFLNYYNQSVKQGAWGPNIAVDGIFGRHTGDWVQGYNWDRGRRTDLRIVDYAVWEAMAQHCYNWRNYEIHYYMCEWRV